mgnify:CR=1 FL=1
MLNYYMVLGVPDFASDREIRNGYREKCRQYHPDLVSNLGSKLAEVARREMTLINKAYEILGNPDKRIHYDTWLKDASNRDSLRPCVVCGLMFVPADDEDSSGLCAECKRNSRREQPVSPGEETKFHSFDVLKMGFVAMHHFVSGMTRRKVVPVMHLVAGPEKVHASGPPGDLEINLFNKELHDLVRPDMHTTKRPWSHLYNRGAVSIREAHPAKAAKALWCFLDDALGEPDIEYCRICIPDENFRPYEHLLNQAAMIAVGRLSPWIASKLFARHGGNIIHALRDPEAGNTDLFYTVMSGAANASVQGRIKSLKEENENMREELKSLRSNLAYLAKLASANKIRSA